MSPAKVSTRLCTPPGPRRGGGAIPQGRPCPPPRARPRHLDCLTCAAEACFHEMARRYLYIEDRDGLCVVAINRPPANALVPELMEEGRDLVEELTREPPQAVVLTGAGDFFSGGVDLKVAPTLSVEDQRRMVESINALFAAWYGYQHPVVAAVNGHAVAGGLILALCADHRIAASGGSYGLTEVRVGIPYPAAALGVVKAELEPGVARRLVLGAELIDAERAHEWGVFDEVAPPDQVLPRALEAARDLAALPSHTFAAVKRELRASALEAITSGIQEDPASTSWLHDETRAAATSVLSGRTIRARAEGGTE